MKSTLLWSLGLFQSMEQLNYFEKLLLDNRDYELNLPSQHFQSIWDEYQNSCYFQNSENVFFRAIVILVLQFHKIRPLYLNAKLFPFPNIEFDCATYSKVFGPIIFTPTINSFGEYKLAAMKSDFLHQVHRRSKSFLITLDEKEAADANMKIKTGLFLGLDKVVVANDSSFDALIEELQSYELYSPEPVDILTSTRFISSEA